MKLQKLIKKELIWETAIFCFGMADISLFHNQTLLLTSLLMIGWIIGMKFWHKKHDLYFLVAGAVIGPVGEIVCIHFGAWNYANPDFLGIPMWLPLTWGLFTMLIKRVAETFVRIEMK